MIRTLLGYDYFVSYCHGRENLESPGATYGPQLADALRQRGFRVCIDTRDYPSGRDLSWLMRHRITKSRYLIVVLDQAASVSDWVLKEVETARLRGRPRIFVDLDETHKRLAQDNPLRVAAEGTIRRRDSKNGPSKVLLDTLESDFEGERIERQETRLVRVAAIVGFLLATAAVTAAFIAWRRAMELQDRLLLAAAERAANAGDFTHARLFLRDVNDIDREAWTRLAFRVGASSPETDWQAPEWLLGQANDSRFVTMDDTGYVHLRDIEDPRRSIRMRWPFSERPTRRSDDSRNDVILSADGRFLALNVSGAGAVWQNVDGAEPIASGRRVAMDSTRGWLLVFQRDAVELRPMSDPARVLSQYGPMTNRPTFWFAWADAGAVISTDSGPWFLLGRDKAEAFPFKIRDEIVPYYVLDTAALELVEVVSPPSARCIPVRLHVRHLGGGWARLSDGSRDEWTVCASSSLRPIAYKNHAVAWAPAGLAIFRIDGTRVHFKEVALARFPGCRWEVYEQTCELSLNADGNSARVTVRKRWWQGSQSPQPSWDVAFASGTVTPLNTVTASTSRQRDQLGDYADAPWHVSGYDIGVEYGRLLVWPTSDRDAAPWRVDFPNRPIRQEIEVQAAASGRHLVAGWTGDPSVRHWLLPEKLASQNRVQSSWWLRDGRPVFYDRLTSNGVRILDVGASDPVSIEVKQETLCGAETSGPDRAILSANGSAIILAKRTVSVGRPLPLLAIALKKGAARCLPIHASFGRGYGEIALDEAGRWLAKAGTTGIQLWPTDSLDTEGRVLTRDPQTNPVFSADGAWLHTRDRSNQVVLWSLPSGKDRRIETPSAIRETRALDNGLRYAVRTTSDRTGAYLLNLETGVETELASFSEEVTDPTFSPSAQYIVARTTSNQVVVWTSTTPNVVPFRYTPPRWFRDVRWVDEAHLNLLMADGNPLGLFLDQRMKNSEPPGICALPSTRREWLEEPPQAARQAYERCVLGPSWPFKWFSMTLRDPEPSIE